MFSKKKTLHENCSEKLTKCFQPALKEQLECCVGKTTFETSPEHQKLQDSNQLMKHDLLQLKLQDYPTGTEYNSGKERRAVYNTSK